MLACDGHSEIVNTTGLSTRTSSSSSRILSASIKHHLYEVLMIRVALKHGCAQTRITLLAHGEPNKLRGPPFRLLQVLDLCKTLPERASDCSVMRVEYELHATMSFCCYG